MMMMSWGFECMGRGRSLEVWKGLVCVGIFYRGMGRRDWVGEVCPLGGWICLMRTLRYLDGK